MQIREPYKNIHRAVGTIAILIIPTAWSFGAVRTPHSSHSESPVASHSPLPLPESISFSELFSFPEPPSALPNVATCTSSSPGLESLMARFNRLRTDVGQIGCASAGEDHCPPLPLNCVNFLASSTLEDKAELTCDEVDAKNMGANSNKVLILKKAGVAKYAVKGFSSEEPCNNEARKLENLNGALKAATESAPFVRMFPNPETRPFLVIPPQLQMSKMISHGKLPRCHLVLEAAKGTPVFNLASDYVETGEGSPDTFTNLGRQLALLHTNNVSNRLSGADLASLKSAAHGDFQWNNVFFDPVTGKFTLIDNSTFASDKKGTPVSDLSTSLRDITQSISGDLQSKIDSPRSDFHWTPEDQKKMKRKIDIIQHYISGYSAVLAEKGVQYRGEPAETKLNETHVQFLKNEFNRLADKCLETLCDRSHSGPKSASAPHEPAESCPECPSRF